MSIYATLAEIGVRRFGDKDFADILIQAVPPHIDDVGPEWAFLPPPVDPDGALMRAVFFVEVGDDKGTQRCGQEYVRPLLMLNGRESEDARFADVMSRLEDALDAKYGKRPGGVLFPGPDGESRNLY